MPWLGPLPALNALQMP